MTTPALEWAVATRPLEAGVKGESGDAYLVHPSAGGTMVAVVDGLGHGHDAATAAREAIRLLASADFDDPAAALKACHEGLRETRGVVIALAWIDESRDRVTWLAVGDVQCVLLRGGHPGASEAPVSRGGVVGRRISPVHASTVPIAPGDLLVFATDGIQPYFAQQVRRLDSPRQVADFVMAGHRTGADDALVLAVRYRGASA